MLTTSLESVEKKQKNLEEHADIVNNHTETDKLKSNNKDLSHTRLRLSKQREHNKDNIGNNKKRFMDL